MEQASQIRAYRPCQVCVLTELASNVIGVQYINLLTDKPPIMMHRAAMFHPSGNHCLPDTHHHKCLLSHVCFIIFLYILYLFEYSFRPQGSQDSVHRKYKGKHGIICFTGTQLRLAFRLSLIAF